MKFYSEKLKKLFDTPEQVAEAEKIAEAEVLRKQKAAEDKKADANKVEVAFKERNIARREYNSKIIEAKKALNAAYSEAKEAYHKAVCDASAAKDKAEEVYDLALKEFVAKHPEGYHMTLKDGDNVMTISSSSDKQLDSIQKEYNEFLNLFSNFWKL